MILNFYIYLFFTRKGRGRRGGEKGRGEGEGRRGGEKGRGGGKRVSQIYIAQYDILNLFNRIWFFGGFFS